MTNIVPSLKIILDAELKAGNTIARIESDAPPWRNAVYLKLPFHDSYFSTMRIRGVYRGIPAEENAGPNLEWYEFKDDALFAPMPKVFRYTEYYERAKKEGRALPVDHWMKEPKPRHQPARAMDLYGVVADYADRIEAEMRRIGLWSEHPPAPKAFQFQRAFAGDTMSYEQWLQFIFLPRVRQIIEERGRFPGSSSTGAQAVREFDGRDECSDLISLLSEFDGLFRGPGGGPGLRRGGRSRLRYMAIAILVLVGAWAMLAVRISAPIARRFSSAFTPAITQRISMTPAGQRFGGVTIDLTGDLPGGDALAPRAMSVSMTHNIMASGGFKARVLEIQPAERVCRVLSTPNEPEQPWSFAALESWLEVEWARDQRDATSPAFQSELRTISGWLDMLLAVNSKTQLDSTTNVIASEPGYRVKERSTFDIPAQTPGWIGNAIAVTLTAAGGVPIAAVMIRWFRLPAYAS